MPKTVSEFLLTYYNFKIKDIQTLKLCVKSLQNVEIYILCNNKNFQLFSHQLTQVRRSISNIQV